MKLSELQDELQRQVQEEHRREPHPELSNEQLQLHVALHVVVETQVLQNDPPQAAQTLQRLQGEGLDRHQAIHLISQAVSDEMLAITKQQRPFSLERYLEHLQQLSAAAVLSKEPEDQG